MKKELKQYLVGTSENPPRYLRLKPHGEVNDLGVPDYYEVALKADRDYATVTENLKVAEQRKFMVEHIWPRIRAEVFMVHVNPKRGQ